MALKDKACQPFRPRVSLLSLVKGGIWVSVALCELRVCCILLEAV